MRRPLVAAGIVALLLARAAAGATPSDWLDRLDDATRWQSPGGLVRLDLSGRVDVEGYYIDQRPPGLIFGGDESFMNPRLVMFADAWIGRRLYAFTQARFDRGFDPRQQVRQARADEYLLRYTPFDQPVLNMQVGKFATVVGNWAPRSDAWNNPFITAPLPYERVTTVSDDAGPDTPAAFLARRDLADKKRRWLPVIWGPSYASGLAAFGGAGIVDYAAEVKNASLSSRPSQWGGMQRGWDEPTASGRLGLRPSAPWAFGVSGSTGPYLEDSAAPSLHGFGDTSDYRETVLGADARWAWHHLEVWAELFLARFEVPIPCVGCRTGPRVEDADSLSYYVEGRYKLTPSLFAAVRANQQIMGKVRNAQGAHEAWDQDMWRVDTALTYRFDRHFQAKLQYAIGKQTGDLQQGEQLVAAQVSIRF